MEMEIHEESWKIPGTCWAACAALWQFSKVTKNELTIWLHCEWSPGNQSTRRFTGACTAQSPYKPSAARPRFDQMCDENFDFANQDINLTVVMSESCCLSFALKWLFNSMLDLQREKSYKSFIQIALTKIESSWDTYTFLSSPIPS